ncbi:MAG: YdbH domain-containing protein, partial [Shewanella sp.]
MKKRVKQSLIATALAGMLAGIALTVWIVNSETETLILRAANYALSGMDSELTDIRLGSIGLEHWQIRSASLRVHDSHLVINNLDIQLALNWPNSVAELLQLGQLDVLSQKIQRISTGEIEVELGQSLFERSPSIADEQTPAIPLNIKSLPLIEIGKTTLSLTAQADHSAYQLVMDKLSLDKHGELTTAFSHEDEPLISLIATLGSNEWTLKSKLNIAPLLESLHQISLRQTPTSILSQLIQWDQQWQALGITLSGQLVSQSTFKLATGDIKSEHQFIQPSVTLAHFADFTLAPQPAVEFGVSGSLAAVNLTLEPFSLALAPNITQQAQLL